jgi:hypothetical protein
MDHAHLRPSHWRHLLSLLFGETLPSALGFSAGHVGDVATTTVEIHFTGNVNATDYTAGVTIKVNSVSQTISSATRQDDHAQVFYVIAAAVDVDDPVTFQYDDATGDYQDDYGAHMGDIAAQTTTNYVGSHLYFDTADDAVWIGATA